MGDSRGGLTKNLLRHRRAEQIEQQNFEQSLLGLKRQQEMSNLSKTMSPHANPTNNRGLFGVLGQPDVTAQLTDRKLAPYNPSLEQYRRDQIDLSRDRLDLARDRERNTNQDRDRSLDIRERLASLKDLTDSERIELLQSGRIDLATYNAAQAMARTQVTQAGADRRNEATNKAAGERTAATIKGAGERTQATIEAGDRRTNAIIAGQDRRSTAANESRVNTPAQRRIDMQNKVARLRLLNPDWDADTVTIDDNGLPVLKKGIDPELATQIYGSLYSPTRGDINLPAEQPVVTQPAVTQPTAKQPTSGKTPSVYQKTDSFKPDTNQPPPASGQGVIKQYSPSRNRTRISTDGGKTWTEYEGRR